MNASNFSAAVAMCGADRTFSCNNTPVLTLSITYPEAALPCNSAAQRCMNRDISAQVRGFYGFASNDLCAQAFAGCKEACKNGYPFNSYDAVLQYEITYNQQCYLSLYRDQYTYTGGAHGNTVRSSDTWNLESGCKPPLACFFPDEKDYRAFLIGQILCLADRQMQQNPGIYFENYRELIAKHFNEKSYYLTPDGLAVYYQQYEIAPYSTGIVVFTIPYETLKWQPACCKSSATPLGTRQ